MGIYLNPNNLDFGRALNSEIYVDKSMLIEHTNAVIYTEQQFICVSRPRRFGKSITANMLVAYYSRGCNSREMFSNLKIAQSASFEKHLNHYNVIHLNMIEFLNESEDIDDMIDNIQKSILYDITDEFPEVRFYDSKKLARSLKDVFVKYNFPFIFIIDEWDCIFRIYKNNTGSQTRYLDFLRKLLKDQSYVALAYMTGILPIKKYGEHSALNIFTEISMSNAREYAEFTGFTEMEVEKLCRQYSMPYDETKHWYDGYNLKGMSVYNPCSVVMSMTGHDFDNYWTSTETYEALKVYIEMDFDGLRGTIVELLAGGRVAIDIGTFTNDMVTFYGKDDVLTLLIHLGYLTYDFYTKEVWIPNYEIVQQFASTLKVIGWSEVADSLKQSDELLRATLSCEEEKVARMIEKAHSDNASILKYHDENSFACVVSIAYYSARKNYAIHRELPSGKGFADLVLIPRRNVNTPAVIIELKYEKTVDSAIEQMKDRNYIDGLKGYQGEVLLVGIRYDRKDKNKKHVCKIEKVTKSDS